MILFKSQLAYESTGNSILYSVIYGGFGHFPAFRMSALTRIAIQPESTPGRSIPLVTLLEIKHPLSEKENWRQSVVREHICAHPSAVVGGLLSVRGCSSERLSQSYFLELITSYICHVNISLCNRTEFFPYL
jgi:hypothetical protein